MSRPAYTNAEARTRKAFLALMWSLSHPGRPYPLPPTGEPFELIAEALLDLETSYYTDDAPTAARLARTGARQHKPDLAAYHFYPALTTNSLADIERASVGNMQYPDEAATLIIGCALGTGTALQLVGPGINRQTAARVGNVPPEFWALREQRLRFPLGWDVFLVYKTQVIGLPRTTRINVETAAGDR